MGMSEEEMELNFSEEELEFLERLFGIIGGFAASIANDVEQHSTLQVDISTKNNLVEIILSKGE